MSIISFCDSFLVFQVFQLVISDHISKWPRLPFPMAVLQSLGNIGIWVQFQKRQEIYLPNRIVLILKWHHAQKFGTWCPEKLPEFQCWTDFTAMIIIIHMSFKEMQSSFKHWTYSCFSYFGFEIRWIHLISWIRKVLYEYKTLLSMNNNFFTYNVFN